MTLPRPRDRTRLSYLLAVVAALSPPAMRLFAASSDPPPPSEPRQPARAEAVKPDNLAVWRALNAPEAIRVQQMPLSQFVESLSKRHKIAFKLDAAGLRRAHVEPDAPITANTRRIPIGTNLRQILGNLRLTYRVADGVVLISDRARLQQPAKIARGVVPNKGPLPGRQLARPLAAMRQGKLISDSETFAQVELLFVKKVCAPTPDQMRAIKQDLDKCLHEAETRPAASTCILLPPRIAECVAKHLTNEQAARYRTEIQKRAIHEREGCVDTVIALLDQKLELSENQRNSLVASLTANWKPGWSQIVEMAVRNGDNAVPHFPDKLIVPCLDAEQFAAWQVLPKSTSVDDPPFDTLRIGAVGTPEAADAN